MFAGGDLLHLMAASVAPPPPILPDSQPTMEPVPTCKPTHLSGFPAFNLRRGSYLNRPPPAGDG